MAEEQREGVILERPNREKASSKATRAIVVLLLLVSIGLMLIVCIGGWPALEGAEAMVLACIAVYLILAFFARRWNRRGPPLATALGIVLLIFAAIAGPEWFARDKDGFSDPNLDESV